MRQNATGNGRQTLRDDEHQPWCDVNEHALTAEGDPETGCCGRAVELDKLGGWWHQRRVGDRPRFAFDVPGRGDWDPTADEMRWVRQLLAIDPATRLSVFITMALAELDGTAEAGQ